MYSINSRVSFEQAKQDMGTFTARKFTQETLKDGQGLLMPTQMLISEQKHSQTFATKLLLNNKRDLESKRQVSTEGQEWAK